MSLCFLSSSGSWARGWPTGTIQADGDSQEEPVLGVIMLTRPTVVVWKIWECSAVGRENCQHWISLPSLLAFVFSLKCLHPQGSAQPSLLNPHSLSSSLPKLNLQPDLYSLLDASPRCPTDTSQPIQKERGRKVISPFTLHLFLCPNVGKWSHHPPIA